MLIFSVSFQFYRMSPKGQALSEAIVWCRDSKLSGEDYLSGKDMENMALTIICKLESISSYIGEPFTGWDAEKMYLTVKEGMIRKDSRSGNADAAPHSRTAVSVHQKP
ncbi:hypothetical protein VNO77_27269 [Canavalia gladiata]|uniref:Uncharacterized protein n=1 Tax=Canavalia gladiata TaxID=3824 RepID=A0AAN9QAC6_CANGL